MNLPKYLVILPILLTVSLSITVILLIHLPTIQSNGLLLPVILPNLIVNLLREQITKTAQLCRNEKSNMKNQNEEIPYSIYKLINYIQFYLHIIN